MVFAAAAVERAMKMQEVILRALSGALTWLQAADTNTSAAPRRIALMCSPPSWVRFDLNSGPRRNRKGRSLRLRDDRYQGQRAKLGAKRILAPDYRSTGRARAPRAPRQARPATGAPRVGRRRLGECGASS